MSPFKSVLATVLMSVTALLGHAAETVSPATRTIGTLQARVVAGPQKVFIDGDRALVAAGSRMLVFDVSNPAAPRLRFERGYYGTIRSLTATNDIYYIGLDNGIISDELRSDGTPIRTVSANYGSGPISLSGNYIYANGGVEGLFILNRNIDYSGGAQVIRLTGILPGYFVNGPLVVGDRGYLGDSGNINAPTPGLSVLDLSNPGSPSILHRFRTDGYPNEMASRGNLLATCEYSASGSAVRIYDISNITNVTRIASFVGGFPSNPVFVGDRLFVINGGSMVWDPTKPTEMTKLPEIPWTVSGLDVRGNHAFVADFTSLRTYDISTPTPRLVHRWVERGVIGDTNLAFSVAGKYVFTVARESGLQVFDITYPALPKFVTNLVATNMVTAGAFSNGVAFLCSTNQVTAVDISNPSAPTIISVWPAPTTNQIVTNAVFVRDGFEYRSGENSVEIRDIRDPLRPVFWGSVATDGRVVEIIPVGESLFLFSENGSFKIIQRNYRIIRLQVPERRLFTVGETLRISWSTEGDPSDQWEVRITCTNGSVTRPITMPVPAVRDSVNQWHTDWAIGEPFTVCGGARITVTELYTRTTLDVFGNSGVLFEPPPTLTLQRGTTNRIVLPAGSTQYGLESATTLTGQWQTITNAPKPTLYQTATYPIPRSTNAEARFYRLKRD